MEPQIPRFRQIDSNRAEELKYSRYFRVIDPDSRPYEIEVHYLTVRNGQYWCVKFGVDGTEDLGAFETLTEPDGAETLALTPWVRKVVGDKGDWLAPYLGGPVEYLTRAGFTTEEIKKGDGNHAGSSISKGEYIRQGPNGGNPTSPAP